MIFLKKILFINMILLLFLREFQFMVSALDDSSLSPDQDTNQFLV